jgi:hypothetical protein
MPQDRFLSRVEASDFLKSRGLHYTANTLQKMATLGGGPIYRRCGNRAVYLAADLEAWVASKLSAPRFSTSQAA